MWLSQKITYFLLYFALNLILTVTNKQILGGTADASSRKPYLLTSIHAFGTSVGCFVFQALSTNTGWLPLINRSGAHPTTLTTHQRIQLAAFSLFYTINIALSNWSLALVSLAINHAIRATAPILTVLVSVVVLRKSLTAYTTSTRLSLIPISLGVVIATTGSIASSPFEHGEHLSLLRQTSDPSVYIGPAITLLSALTAVTKTVLTHKLTTSLSLKLSPLELLQVLCPYAAVQALTFAYFSGELDICPDSMGPTVQYSTAQNHTHWLTQNGLGCDLLKYQEGGYGIPRGSVLILWVANAVAAFLLNVVSFKANKLCGPVSIAVAANLKQVVVLVISMVASNNAAFRVEKNSRVVFGSILTVVGGIWYSGSIRRKSAVQALPTILTASHKRSNQIEDSIHH